MACGDKRFCPIPGQKSSWTELNWTNWTNWTEALRRSDKACELNWTDAEPFELWTRRHHLNSSVLVLVPLLTGPDSSGPGPITDRMCPCRLQVAETAPYMGQVLSDDASTHNWLQRRNRLRYDRNTNWAFWIYTVGNIPGKYQTPPVESVCARSNLEKLTECAPLSLTDVGESGVRRRGGVRRPPPSNSNTAHVFCLLLLPQSNTTLQMLINGNGCTSCMKYRHDCRIISPNRFSPTWCKNSPFWDSRCSQKIRANYPVTILGGFGNSEEEL